jgi:drug/metabolite transporter (DMT)-like permease
LGADQCRRFGMTLAVPLHIILVAIIIHSLWGGNPVAVKFSLEVFPPLWTAFFRFLVGVVCVTLWAYARGVRIWPERHEWRPLFLIAIVFAAQIGLMNIGYAYTNASMGAVLIATNPLFAAFFVHFTLDDDRLTPMRCLGLALAMFGAAICLLQDADLTVLDFGAIGNWIVLASACLLGLRLSISARVMRDVHEVRVIVWQTIFALPLFALGALSFETIQWQNMNWRPIAGILYQGIVVAGLSFTVFYSLMKRYKPSVIMSFNFVSPVAGVLLAVWLLDESISAMLITGMVFVAAGLVLISRKS